MKNTENKNENERKCHYCGNHMDDIGMTFLGFEKGVCSKCHKKNTYFTWTAFTWSAIIIYLGFQQLPILLATSIDWNNIKYGVIPSMADNPFIIFSILTIIVWIYYFLPLAFKKK